MLNMMVMESGLGMTRFVLLGLGSGEVAGAGKARLHTQDRSPCMLPCAPLHVQAHVPCAPCLQILDRPGSADLSAWVDFGALRAAALGSKAQVGGRG